MSDCYDRSEVCWTKHTQHAALVSAIGITSCRQTHGQRENLCANLCSSCHVVWDHETEKSCLVLRKKVSQCFCIWYKLKVCWGIGRREEILGMSHEKSTISFAFTFPSFVLIFISEDHKAGKDWMAYIYTYI